LQATTPLETIKGTFEYRSFGQTATVQTNGETNTAVTDYSTMPNTGATFLVGVVFVVLSLTVGLGMVVLAARTDPRPNFQRLAVLLGVLAFALVLAAPLYVMVRLPNAVYQDTLAGLPKDVFLGPSVGFWGSNSSSTALVRSSATWGAGWGWYAAVAAAVLFLIAGIVLFCAQPESARQETPQKAQQPQCPRHRAAGRACLRKAYARGNP
jgi:hypothetical protein